MNLVRGIAAATPEETVGGVGTGSLMSGGTGNGIMGWGT